MTEPLNGKLLNCSLQIVLGIALLTLTVTSVRAEQAEDVRMRTVENLARLFSQVPRPSNLSDYLSVAEGQLNELTTSLAHQTRLEFSPWISSIVSKNESLPVRYFEDPEMHGGGLILSVLGSDERLMDSLLLPANDDFWSRYGSQGCDDARQALIGLGRQTGGCFLLYDNMEGPQNGIYRRATISPVHGSGSLSSIVQGAVQLLAHNGMVYAVVQYQHRIFHPPGKLTAEAFESGDEFEQFGEITIEAIRELGIN